MPNRVSVKAADLVGILGGITSAIHTKSGALTREFHKQNTIKSFKEFRELETAFKEAFQKVQKAYSLLERRQK